MEITFVFRFEDLKFRMDRFREDHVECFEDEYDEDEENCVDDLSDVSSDDILSDSENDDSIRLDISSDQARLNLEAAEKLVVEEEDGILLSQHTDLLDIKVNEILNKITVDIDLLYNLSDFQRLSINALGTLKSVVLISPTGSGKMSIPLLAVRVLRKALGIPNGICIVTQPLNSIMNEKLRNNICEAAILTMAGDLIDTGDGEEDDVKLSCSIDDLLSGRILVIFGHPESFDSKMGQQILRELHKRGMLVLLCIDEFHQAGKGHWMSFRPSMMSSSSAIR